ncbi:hypothetical protein Taro_028067 [Colocasia esculenta]|uniref:Jacalin-type lectin domain-containing protein n=1 Tax=Colocasia esculenta TaxID=4460 RepID=A0A843VG80_COLES|nr:hypothetical protein [Colocasia esculenta]
MTPISQAEAAGEVKVGPFGGSTGTLVDVGSASQIRRVRINHGDVIDRLTILYVDVNGTSKEFSVGGIGGLESAFELSDGEHITGVSGSVNSHGGVTCIARLYLATSRGITHGPYGLGGGIPLGRDATPFSFPIDQGMRVGNFFGRGRPFLVSLGAYLEPN